MFVKLRVLGIAFPPSLPWTIVAISDLMAICATETGNPWGIRKVHARGLLMALRVVPWWRRLGEAERDGLRQQKEAFNLFSATEITFCFPKPLAVKKPTILPSFLRTHVFFSGRILIFFFFFFMNNPTGEIFCEKHWERRSLIAPYTVELLGAHLRNIKL